MYKVDLMGRGVEKHSLGNDPLYTHEVLYPFSIFGNIQFQALNWKSKLTFLSLIFE